MSSMEALSPALSNGGNATPTTSASTPPPPTASKSPVLSTVKLQRSEPPKNLRGLNKPKCIKCGNVARSRCPYQSCKSCCSKAQNPCHIHVLKPNATLADREASTNSTTQQQQPNEAPASGSSGKVSSFRQLSSNFAQFNNVHVPLRSRKPVTRREALAINAWRFAKLKEYKEMNIEAENEAFDRYMQNINLLEEIFDVNYAKSDGDGSLPANHSNSGDQMEETISEMKVKLRSNPVRIDKFRKRIQQAVDQGLKKLPKYDSQEPIAVELTDEGSLAYTAKTWAGGTSALLELNDRLNKVQSAEDLKHCIQMRSKIRGDQKASFEKFTESTEISKEQGAASVDLPLAQEDSDISQLKLVRSSEINQDALNSMNFHFSSLEEIEDL